MCLCFVQYSRSMVYFPTYWLRSDTTKCMYKHDLCTHLIESVHEVFGNDQDIYVGQWKRIEVEERG